MCFVLASYSWAWGLPWSRADIPSTLHQKNMCFSLSYQVSIANSFFHREGFGIHFCLLVLDFVCLEPVQVLWVLAQALYKFIWALVLLYLEDTISLESFSTSNSYKASASSSELTPEPQGQVFAEDIPFTAECYRVSAHCSVGSLW